MINHGSRLFAFAGFLFFGKGEDSAENCSDYTKADHDFQKQSKAKVKSDKASDGGGKREAECENKTVYMQDAFMEKFFNCLMSEVHPGCF